MPPYPDLRDYTFAFIQKGGFCFFLIYGSYAAHHSINYENHGIYEFCNLVVVSNMSGMSLSDHTTIFPPVIYGLPSTDALLRR
jgi:hypothetical protein